MRVIESRLRRIVRSVLVESSKSVLTKKEEVIDKFESIVNSDLEEKIKKAIKQKESGKISSIAMVLGRKIRSAYKEKYTIDLSQKEFRSAVNIGLKSYISDLEKK